jgi:hypothetical protein
MKSARLSIGLPHSGIRAIIIMLLMLFVGILPQILLAQSSMIDGMVYDETGTPLGFATVTLLHPSDSTLAFYGITNAEGHYQIKKTKPGDYLLQVGYLGHIPYYQTVKLPLEEGHTMKTVVMQAVPLDLREVNIEAEHVPFLIKKDTIEYNAAAFRTRPDAVVEDLIKKLPGIEVDRVGNIKALGEDVQNVLVDGKEFFSSDPKVATKNLPADAIKRVQVYDKKSDQSELTGISDGERNKTVNLVLKDDKKKAWFGNLKAGGGTDAHYRANAKVYRFTDKHQFAVLGMVNNTNQFGFSFQDYLDFSGGLQSMMSGGGGTITIGGNGNIPVNFGQPIEGLVTSGAAGINFTHEAIKDNRFNISYLGSGMGQTLDESVRTENFTSTSSFLQELESHSQSEDWNHGLNLSWKNKSDSMQTIALAGNASLNNGTSRLSSETFSYSGDTLMNQLNRITHGRSNQLNPSLSGSWMRKGRGKTKLIKLSGSADYGYGLSRSEWENITQYLGISTPFVENQFLHNKTDYLNASLNLSMLQQIGPNWYIQPAISGGGKYDWIDRKQGTPGINEQVIDSLSPWFSSRYQWVKPGIGIKRSTTKTQLRFGVDAEWGEMANFITDSANLYTPTLFVLPNFSWEYEYKTGSRVTFFYNTQVITPTALELLPVVKNQNPLNLFAGNRRLKPASQHNIFAQWFLYDAFSFTSLFISLNGTYTHNKVSYARWISDSLAQATTLINVPDDYLASLKADFSTPIRKLGINVHLDIRESWNQAITMIDNQENINTNWNHAIRVSIDNRKKTKFDAMIGIEFDLTNARYSIQESLNTDYFNLVYFGEVNYNPNDHWHFMVGADVTNYNAETFEDAISIPLLRAAIDFSFLKNRLMLSLEGYDLLNRNTGVTRTSEQNYLQETRTNSIGRYVMLSLKFRLNKFGGNSGGIFIKG